MPEDTPKEVAKDLKREYEEEAHDVTAKTDDVVKPITDPKLRAESDAMQKDTDPE